LAIDPLPILATFAGVIALGFLGYVLFDRTRITDVLLLIAFGVLVGPVFGVFDVEGFKSASGLVGTLALIVIMFDGGLGLHLRDLVSGIARSTVLAVVGFVATVGLIAGVGHFHLGLDWPAAALLGTILGGTSGVIIMPIISRTTAANGTRVLLSVESALTDVLCVIGTVTLVAFFTTTADASSGERVGGALRSIASQFSTAIVLGLFGGVVWLRLLKRLQSMRYSYMITLSAILFLYVGAEAVGGNGAIAALIFGVVLGNGFIIARKLAFEGLEFSDQQRQFQSEVAFLIRAFFFVYLGVILDPALVLQTRFLVDAAVILAAALAARVLAVSLATRGDGETSKDRGLITLLFPRGLAAAVLAGLPAAAGVPGTESFVALAFIVIVATNLVGTGAVVGYEMKKRRMVDVPVVAPTAEAPASVPDEAAR